MAYIHPTNKDGSENEKAVEEIYAQKRRWEAEVYPPSILENNGTTHWPEGTKSTYASRGRGRSDGNGKGDRRGRGEKGKGPQTTDKTWNVARSKSSKGYKTEKTEQRSNPIRMSKQIEYPERAYPFDERTITDAELQTLSNEENAENREKFRNELLKRAMIQGLNSCQSEEYMRATQEYWASEGKIPQKQITVFHDRVGSQHHRVSAVMLRCGCEIVGTPTLGKNRSATCLWRDVLTHEVCGKCDAEGRRWFLKGERENAKEEALQKVDNSFKSDEQISQMLPAYENAADQVALSNAHEVCGESVLNLLATLAATENVYGQDVTATPISKAKYVPNAYQPLHDFATYLRSEECITEWTDSLDPAVKVTPARAKITAWRIFEDNGGCVKKTLNCMRERFINSFDMDVTIFHHDE